MHLTIWAIWAYLLFSYDCTIVDEPVNACRPFLRDSTQKLEEIYKQQPTCRAIQSGRSVHTLAGSRKIALQIWPPLSQISHGSSKMCLQLLYTCRQWKHRKEIERVWMKSLFKSFLRCKHQIKWIAKIYVSLASTLRWSSSPVNPENSCNVWEQHKTMRAASSHTTARPQASSDRTDPLRLLAQQNSRSRKRYQLSSICCASSVRMQWNRRPQSMSERFSREHVRESCAPVSMDVTSWSIAWSRSPRTAGTGWVIHKVR